MSKPSCSREALLRAWEEYRESGAAEPDATAPKMALAGWFLTCHPGESGVNGTIHEIEQRIADGVRPQYDNLRAALGLLYELRRADINQHRTTAP